VRVRPDGIAFMSFDMRHKLHGGFWSYEVCGGSGVPFVDPADEEVNEVHKESQVDLEWKGLKNVRSCS
jgi:hypothetical protein